MGLAERRALKEYQDKKFPELKKQIDAAAGFDVTLDVDWDSLTVEGDATNFMQDEYVTNIFFLPLIDALKNITVDEMGKSALKKHLKKIVMKYDQATAPVGNYVDGWPFSDGVLLINYRPWCNSDGPGYGHFKDRVDAITKNLENKL